MPTRAKTAKLPRTVKPERKRKKSLAEMDLEELAREQHRRLAVGASYYASADTVLKEIRKRLGRKKSAKIGGGNVLRIVDNLKDGKIFARTYAKRWESKLFDEAGKEIRFRDTKKSKAQS